MPRRGPATPAGKAAASRNAWKHGILASAMIIPKFEDPRDWEAHRDGIFDSLEPEGHLEHMLAERIAASYDLLAQDGDPAASESY